MQSAKLFRRAKPEDVRFAAELMIASAPELNPVIFAEDLQRLVTEGFQENRGIWAANRAYVVEIDNRVVGVMTAYPAREAPAIFLDTFLFVFRRARLMRALLILGRNLKFGRLYRPLRSGYCYFANLATDPAARGQGVASLLFEKTMELEAKPGIRGFHLDVATDNLNAKRLYEKLGFVGKSESRPVAGIAGLIRMEKAI